MDTSGTIDSLHSAIQSELDAYNEPEPWGDENYPESQDCNTDGIQGSFSRQELRENRER